MLRNYSHQSQQEHVLSSTSRGLSATQVLRHRRLDASQYTFIYIITWTSKLLGRRGIDALDNESMAQKIFLTFCASVQSYDHISTPLCIIRRASVACGCYLYSWPSLYRHLGIFLRRRSKVTLPPFKDTIVVTTLPGDQREFAKTKDSTRKQQFIISISQNTRHHIIQKKRCSTLAKAHFNRRSLLPNLAEHNSCGFMCNFTHQPYGRVVLP